MSTALQPTSIEAVIEGRLKDLPFPKNNTAIETEGKTYQQIHDEQIAEIERRVKMVAPVVDEASRAQVQKTLTALTKVRTGINNFRLDLFGPITELKKKFDGYLGTTKDSGLQARIRAIEIPLEEDMAKYDRELERIRQEELRKIEDRNKARASFVIGAGMTFTGAEYRLDELVLFPVDLNTWNDAAFENWKIAKLQPALQAKADREKAAREAAEKAEAERRAKDAELKAEAEKQAAEKKRMDAERAELEREKAELRKAKNELRRSELLDLGATEHTFGGKPCIACELGDGGWQVDTLADFSLENWEEVKRRVVDAKEKADENLRQMRLEDERSLVLRALSHHRYDGDMVWTCGDLSLTDQQLRTMTPAEWEIELAAFREEDERLSIEVVTPAPALTEEPHPGAVSGQYFDNTDWQDGSHLTLDQLKDKVGVPQMEVVHVVSAPVVQQPVMTSESILEAQTLLQDARFYAARQNTSAYVFSAGDGQFLAFGTADQIRELLKEQ